MIIKFYGEDDGLLYRLNISCIDVGNHQTEYEIKSAHIWIEATSTWEEIPASDVSPEWLLHAKAEDAGRIC